MDSDNVKVFKETLHTRPGNLHDVLGSEGGHQLLTFIHANRLSISGFEARLRYQRALCRSFMQMLQKRRLRGRGHFWRRSRTTRMEEECYKRLMGGDFVLLLALIHKISHTPLATPTHHRHDNV